MLRKHATMSACLAALLAFVPQTTWSQDSVLSFQCDLGGAPAQMIMAVEYLSASGISSDHQGHISGVFPVGVTVYTAGEVVSSVARYSFRGENDFADFTDINSYERFRVRWVLDPQQNGVWMVVNPFGDPTSYFCSFLGPY